MVMITGARLRYIYVKYNKLLENARNNTSELDKRLEVALNPAKSNKEFVLSIANALASAKRLEGEIESDLQMNSSSNIYIDFVSIGTLVLVAIMAMGNYIAEYLPIFVMVASLPTLLSVTTFVNHLKQIQDLKRKFRDQ